MNTRARVSMPTMARFPLLRWNGKEYILHRHQYEGKPCRGSLSAVERMPKLLPAIEFERRTVSRPLAD